MSDATSRGRFVWHELMTTDTKSAAAFFTKVIPWKTQVAPQDPSYTMFVTAGRPVAGLMALAQEAKAMGAPPNWLTYIGTPNVDDTARQAVTLGGKILKQATDIPTVGRFAVLQDPQGAVFAAFTPAPRAQADAPVGLGDFSWHELATTDGPAAFAFYQNLFGWEATDSMDMGPGAGIYQMYGLKGTTLGGIFKPSQLPGPPFWLAYINVADSKKAAETVKKLGGKIINGPMEVPGGDVIAAGMDLQGAMFAVHSKKSAAPSKPAKATAAKAVKKAKPAKKAKRVKKAKTAKKAKPARKAKRAKAASKRSKSRKRASPRKRRR